MDSGKGKTSPLNPASYLKYLLTLDDIPSNANHDGIIQMSLIDWLLKHPL